MAIATMTETPLAGALGAEVRGVRFAEPLDGGLLGAIDQLLAEYLVLFFPGQHLDDREHLAFARQFGEPYIHPIGRVAGRTEAGVEHIVDSEDRPPFQDRWHTDVSWDTEPPTHGTLRAIDMPWRGGDTIWSSMYAAYDALSPTMKELLPTLRAFHDMGAGEAFASKAGAEITARTRELFPGAEHNVVGVHPGTGRRYLYVNRQFTRRIVGLHDAESDAILGFLVEHVTHPNFQVRYHWTAGDVCMWDERVTQHFAVADHYPQRREMGRVPLLGR
jgi:taurine dioxygenase